MISKERESHILRLHHAEQWPPGTIATQLGLHHSTVRRVLAQAGVAAEIVSPRNSIFARTEPRSRRRTCWAGGSRTTVPAWDCPCS